MRFLAKSLIGLFLTATSLAFIAIAANTVRDALSDDAEGNGRNFGARERVFAVNTLTIEPGTQSPVLTAFGEIVSRRSLQIRVDFRETVEWLNPDMVDGGRVSEGDMLMRFDARSARESLALAQASLFEAEAELLDAQNLIALSEDELAAARDQIGLRERAVERQRGLFERGVGSEAALEDANLAASSARQAVLARRRELQVAQSRIVQAASQVNRAKIALEQAERDLADRTIYAAFDGVLSNVGVIVGRDVVQNEVVAELIDPNELEVAFRVSTADYQRLVGSDGSLTKLPVTVALDVLGANISVQGSLTRQSPDVGEGQTGRLLFASLGPQQASASLRTGDFVRVVVEEPPINGVARLPAAAVDSVGNVLALDEEDRLQEVAIEVLRSQGNEVLVRAGALVGRQVVAERSPFLGSGIKVRPLQGNGEAPDAQEPPKNIALDSERRARLIAFVEANRRMPAEAKTRVLQQLNQDEVPAELVERLEGRMNG